MIATISFAIGLIVFIGYIFKTDGSVAAKVSLIICSTVFIFYLIIVFGGIFDFLPNPWKGIVIVSIFSILLLLLFFVFINPNLVKTVDSDGYIRLGLFNEKC